MGRVLQHHASSTIAKQCTSFTSLNLERQSSGAGPQPAKRRLAQAYVLQKIRPENARRRDLARGADEDRKENEKNYE